MSSRQTIPSPSTLVAVASSTEPATSSTARWTKWPCLTRPCLRNASAASITRPSRTCRPSSRASPWAQTSSRATPFVCPPLPAVQARSVTSGSLTSISFLTQPTPAWSSWMLRSARLAITGSWWKMTTASWSVTSSMCRLLRPRHPSLPPNHNPSRATRAAKPSSA